MTYRQTNLQLSFEVAFYPGVESSDWLTRRRPRNPIAYSSKQFSDVEPHPKLTEYLRQRNMLTMTLDMLKASQISFTKLESAVANTIDEEELQVSTSSSFPKIRVRLDWSSSEDNCLLDDDLRPHLRTHRLTPIDTLAMSICALLLWDKSQYFIENACTRQLKIEVKSLLGQSIDLGKLWLQTNGRSLFESMFTTFEISLKTTTAAEGNSDDEEYLSDTEIEG